MRTSRTFANLLVALLAISLLSACSPIKGNSSTAGGTVVTQPKNTYVTYFWLAAVQDATVTDNFPDGIGGGSWAVQTAHGSLFKEYRSYVQFFVPQLPPGSTVVDARINLYENHDSGANGPAHIQVGEAAGPWSATDITWNNQPNPPGPLGTENIGPFIRADMWRTTGNIKNIVQRHIDDPSTNHGFIFNNVSQYTFLRTFTALDTPGSRTSSTLGTAPRLLLKVESTLPLATADVGTFIPSSTEFGTLFGFGTPTVVYQMSSGNGWPAAWEVGTF